MPRWLYTSAGVLVLGVLVYLIVRLIPPGSDPCVLQAEQHLARVDIDATIKGLELLKGKIGVTAGSVREVDGILRDFGTKYRAICNDHRRQAIANSEYNCRRDNMDRALDKARLILDVLNTATQVQDAAEQGQIVRTYIESIKELSKGAYADGCSPVVDVSPKELTFHGSTFERILEVLNGDDRKITYVISDLPPFFATTAATGTVEAGRSTHVPILRLYNAPAAQSTFYVAVERTRLPVTLVAQIPNAGIYSALGDVASHRAKAQNRELAQDDIDFVIEQKFPEADEATRRVLATETYLTARSSYLARVFQDLIENEKSDVRKQVLRAAFQIHSGHESAADAYLSNENVRLEIMLRSLWLHQVGNELGYSMTPLVERANALSVTRASPQRF